MSKNSLPSIQEIQEIADHAFRAIEDDIMRIKKQEQQLRDEERIQDIQRSLGIL